jgi:tight adherence protein C
MLSSVTLMVGLSAFAAAIFVGVLTVAFGSGGRTGVAQALASIDQVYAPGAVTRDENLRDRAVTPTTKWIASIARLLTPKGAAAWLQRWLDYAGNPVAWPPERIMETQGLGLIGLGLVGGLIGMLAGGVVATIVGAVIGALAGLWAPFAIVYDAGVRRQEQIRRQLPDALDLLTVSVEAGLGFDAALMQVAAVMPGALSREIARVLQEMQMGVRRADAMRALGQRTRVIELRTVSVAVVQATDLGIPIAGVLREQAAQMRMRRRQRAEEQARKVPVKIVVPLVLCILPSLFIVVIGPGVLNIMHSFFNQGGGFNH